VKNAPGRFTVACFGAFKADLRAGELLKNGRRIKLQEQPFQILALLLEHVGDVVTREELHQRLWPADTFVDSDHCLNNAMNRLREALGDSVDSPRFIETRSRRGYRFIAPVEEAKAADTVAPVATGVGGNGPRLDRPGSQCTDARERADPSPEHRGGGRPPASRHRSRTEPQTRVHWINGWSLAAGTVGVCAALVFLGAAQLRRPAAIGSIAVLPFDFSGASDRAYFAEILTEELTTSLAQFPALVVTSRRSASRWKGSDRSLGQIAKELNVNAVVHGAVRVDGEHVRVTAQIVRAVDDAHVWAGSYTEQARDIVTVPAELSRAIAVEIRIKITAEQQAALGRLRAISPEAYEAFLRGSAQFREESLAGNESAIAQFKRAIALAPDFDRAYAALARAQIYRYDRWASTPELLQEAFAAAQRAIDINPRSADAYVARSGITGARRSSHAAPSREAIDDLRRALAIDPSLAPPHFYLGDIYMRYGLFEKASAEFSQALALDPEYPQVLFRLPRLHLFQQEYQTALVEFQKSRFTPNWQIPLVLAYLGRQAEALAAIEALHRDYPFDSNVAGAYAVLLAKEGRNQDAERQIQIAIERGEGNWHFHYAEYDIGSAYALMSQPRRALEWFRRAAADGVPCYPRFAHDPNLNGIRDDPGFRTFLGGLRRQWDEWNATL
jgi:TolB-like protein/DNA-binding winged helix-turn-helix (wHTH) protein/Flp pilus assembly protein TadD